MSGKKEPIRVLQYIGSLEAGGSQSMIMNIYRNIDRSKVQFDFVVDRKGKNDLFYKDEIESLGGKVYVFDEYFKGYNYFAFTKQWKEFFKKHPEYKIIHCHVRSVASIVLKIAKQNGLVTICHSHSTSNGKGIKAVAKKMLQSRIHKYCDYYFACSEESARWLYGENITKSDKCIILNNAIDASKYTFDEKVRARVRKELGLEDKKVLGQIGRIEKVKNYDFSIELLSRLLKEDDKYFLLIVGAGSLENSIIEKAKKLGVDKNMLILKNRSDIPELLQAMDVFIMPSLYEGLPVAFVEAQAAGLSCVISDEVKDGWLVNKDIVSISLDDINKWVKTISKKVLAGELHNNNFVEIKKQGFDIEANAVMLMNFYCKVLERRKTFLFVTDTRYVNGKLTGGHKRFLELVNGISRENDVVLISRKIPGLKNANIKNFVIEKDRKTFLPLHIKKMIAICKILRREKRNINYDYAISFCPADTLCYGVCGYGNIITLLREDFVGYRKIVGTSAIKLVYFKWMERYTVRHSQKIIVQCVDDKNILIERYGNKIKDLGSKIYVQINNINASWISDSNMKKKEHDDSIVRIAFIGNFSNNRKGHQLLLPAIKKLIDEGYNIRLFIAGDGKQFESYKREYMGCREMIFLGRVKSSGEILIDSDFEVVPSLMDSCPNTVLEGINIGVPVYGTDVGGIKEILQDKNYLFEPDVDSIYTFIKKKIDTGDYTSDGTKQKVIKHRLTFDWSDRIQNIIDGKNGANR